MGEEKKYLPGTLFLNGMRLCDVTPDEMKPVSLDVDESTQKVECEVNTKPRLTVPPEITIHVEISDKSSRKLFLYANGWRYYNRIRKRQLEKARQIQKNQLRFMEWARFNRLLKRWKEKVRRQELKGGHEYGRED